jgi:hypothetical protein
MILARVANREGKHGIKIHWAAAAGGTGDRTREAVPALAMQSDGGYHAGAGVFLGRCRTGGVSGSCEGRTTAPKGAGRQGEVTEQEIRRVREQWDRAHSRWRSVCRALEEMREVEYDLRRECERLAEIIAEHDDTPIVITEDDGEKA